MAVSARVDHLQVRVRGTRTSNRSPARRPFNPTRPARHSWEQEQGQGQGQEETSSQNQTQKLQGGPLLSARTSVSANPLPEDFAKEKRRKSGIGPRDWKRVWCLIDNSNVTSLSWHPIRRPWQKSERLLWPAFASRSGHPNPTPPHPPAPSSQR